MAATGPDNLSAGAYNTLRSKDVAAVQAELDAQAVKFGGNNKRRGERHQYKPNANIVVTIAHPGGSVIRYAVAARNLSENGIGFLHGSFLHQDTRCIVSLETVSGQWTNLNGVVMRCAYIRNKVHEIGVRFESSIDLSRFLVTGAISGEPDGGTGIRLTGRLLYIEASATDRDLMRYHLEQLGVKSVMTADPAEALGMLDAQMSFDLMALDYHLPGSGTRLILEGVRQRGLDLPVILLTADESAEVRKTAVDGGCQGVLIKPFAPEDLRDLLMQHLPLASGSKQPKEQEPIISTLWSNAPMRPLILKYLGHLEAQLAQVERQLAAESGLEGIHDMLMQIKGSAGGFGFQQISRAAQQMLALDAQTVTPRHLRVQCEQLVQLGRRAAAGHGQPGGEPAAPAGASVKP